MAERKIAVGALARVEGEGGLTIRLRSGKPAEVELRIYEPPRFFEGLLRGRSLLEVPDVTARICGICPVAYQMSGCAAIEDALGIEPGERIRALRRLLYCGEWIESHVLHILLLHAPDFLGLEDGLALAKDHPDRLRAGLRLKKLGNALLAAVGGREIHPVNARIGGFHRAPERAALRALLPELAWGREAARELLAWVAGFRFPDVERDYELVALRHERDYPICEGRIVSSAGLDIAVRDFEAHFVERQVPHSTALHSTVRARGNYLTGPLARLNLDFDRLPPAIQDAARAAGAAPPCRNPFKTILARAVETLFAIDEAARLIEGYEPPDPPFIEVPRRAGSGSGATEAPRGLLYHRYAVDEAGLVRDAKIVPPTAQNLASIEDDLRALAPRLAELPHAEASRLAEDAVRNHDPCISCATHFLRLRIDREGG